MGEEIYTIQWHWFCQCAYACVGKKNHCHTTDPFPPFFLLFSTLSPQWKNIYFDYFVALTSRFDRIFYLFLFANGQTNKQTDKQTGSQTKMIVYKKNSIAIIQSFDIWKIILHKCQQFLVYFSYLLRARVCLKNL